MKDMIYKQDAIDAIRASTSKYTGFMEMEMYTDDDAVEAINGVPSAEPEIIHCRDCKYYDGRPCGIVDWYNTDSDFCSRAERRTDETD